MATGPNTVKKTPHIYPCDTLSEPGLPVVFSQHYCASKSMVRVVYFLISRSDWSKAYVLFNK